MTAAPQDRPATPRHRAAAVVIRDTTVLLVRHHDGTRGWWTLPGGGIEAGETSGRAACRELAEETGLAGRPRRLLYIRRIPTGIEAGWHLDATGDATVDHAGLDPELVDVGWFDLAGLRDDVQIRLVLAALRRR